jgi:DNA-binding CsgD family transcriptional regulator
LVQRWGGILPESTLARALGEPVTLACLGGVPGVYTDEVTELAREAHRQWAEAGSPGVPDAMALSLPHLLAVSETTPVTDVDLHRALATCFDDVDRARSAYHEALSTGAADALDIAQARADIWQGDGSVVDAFHLYRLIADHSPAPRSDLRRTAALCAAAANEWHACLHSFDLGLAETTDALQRTSIERSRAWARIWTLDADASTAARDLLAVLEQSELPQDESAATDIALAWASAIAMLLMCDAFAASDASRRAPKHPATLPDRVVTALLSLDRRAAPELPAAEHIGPPLITHFTGSRAIAVEMRLMEGDWVGASGDVHADVDNARRMGLLGDLGPALGRAVVVDVFRGELRAALGAGREGVDLLPNDGSMLASAALAAISVGTPEGLDWAERCRELGVRHGITAFRIDAAHRCGLEALSRNDLDGARVHLEECDELMERYGFMHPGYAYSRGDIGLVRAQTGDRVGAMAMVRRLEIAETDQTWLAGCAARIRFVLGEEPAFERAIDLFHTSPWEVARTHLVAAMLDTPARSHHGETAYDMFVSLGSPRWAGLATHCLEQGTTAMQNDCPAAENLLDRLSRRERLVAEAVGEGLSNKDVSARLFISVRTVETHLQSIFRKVEVASRAQLIARLHGGR